MGQARVTRIWHVCVAVIVAVSVVGPVVMLTDDRSTTEADIGPEGERTAAESKGYYIARNLPLGKSILLCTSVRELPVSTKAAVDDINAGLRAEGVATRFNVFRLATFNLADTETPHPCPTRVRPTTDRIDYVRVRPMERGAPRCAHPSAVGCFRRDHPSNYNETLNTYASTFRIWVHHDFAKDDSADNTDLVSILVHEILHALGVPEEYYRDGETDCVKTAATKNFESAMHCYDEDEEYEAPYIKPYDRRNIANIYRPARVKPLTGTMFAENRKLGNVYFGIDASNVFVDTGIEIRRKDGTVWSDVLFSWDPEVKRLEVTLAGQPLGLLTYGIFRRSAVLESEQEVIPAPQPPLRGASEDNGRQSDGDGATRSVISQVIGFLQEVPVDRLGDQILSGFKYTPPSIYLGAAAPTVTLPTGAQGDLSFDTETTDVCEVDANTGDLFIEGAGTCIVTVTAAATDTYHAGTAEATVTVNLPTVTISGPTGVDEGDPVTFTISQTRTGALTVNISETRTPATFFPDPARDSIPIPAGSSSVDHTVRTTDVPGVQANGLLTVSVRAGTGYEVGSSRTATVTVRDDDTTPTPPTPPTPTPTTGCTVWGYSWAGRPPPRLPIGGYTGGGFTSSSAAQVSLNSTLEVLRSIGYTGLDGAVHCFTHVPPPSPAQLTITLAAGLNYNIAWRGAVLPTDSITTYGSLPTFQAAYWLNPATNAWHVYIHGAPAFVNARDPVAQLRPGRTYTIKVSAASTWLVDAAHGVSAAARGEQGSSADGAPREGAAGDSAWTATVTCGAGPGPVALTAPTQQEAIRAASWFVRAPAGCGGAGTYTTSAPASGALARGASDPAWTVTVTCDADPVPLRFSAPTSDEAVTAANWLINLREGCDGAGTYTTSPPATSGQ